MSYDIQFGVKVAGAAPDTYAVVGEPEYDSPTYNLGRMFRACTGWDYTQGEWYQMDEVMPKIEHGLHELRFNAKEYKQYEPDNGWGTIGSAINCLQSIVDWFTDPYGSRDDAIPLSCYYMRW